MADPIESAQHTLSNPGTRRAVLIGGGIAVGLALLYYYQKSKAPAAPATGSTSAQQSGINDTANQLGQQSVNGLAGTIQSGILGLASGIHYENQQIANNLSLFEKNQSLNNTAIAAQFGGLQNWLTTMFAQAGSKPNDASYFSAGAESFAACRSVVNTNDARTYNMTVGAVRFDPACLASKGNVGIAPGVDPLVDWQSRFSACTKPDGATDFVCAGKVILGA